MTIDFVGPAAETLAANVKLAVALASSEPRTIAEKTDFTSISWNCNLPMADCAFDPGRHVDL
ncbi:hypothetical protein [Nevskia sp.]|uniref:hypothetical protein n=1 Tax=Nevskia sp. TaxID=1929292 RepID=UPI0025E0C041|nr:hypothetical protein [Nevskia sp.]